MGGTYIRHGDYLIPSLTLSEENLRFIDRGDYMTDKKTSQKEQMFYENACIYSDK